MTAPEAATLAQWLTSHGGVVVFSGAGISTESGIPDFRSPGGIWDQFDPEEMTYQNFLSSAESRKSYWSFHYHSWQSIRRAKPNPAHRAVAQMEELVDLIAVITQNIDGLHQSAGSDPGRVFELHGTLWRARCLDCEEVHSCREAFEQIEAGTDIPRCRACGGDLKPGTVAFGEPLPEDVMSPAQSAAATCGVFVAVGSSLSVYPAALLPEMAAGAGARLVIINRDPTPLDPTAHLVVHGNAGEILPQVINHLRP